jgi:hypothetical protein
MKARSFVKAFEDLLKILLLAVRLARDVLALFGEMGRV